VGKSHVSAIFSALGCHVLDADHIAREVVAPGSAGLAAVAAAFGRDIISIEGTLDRERLGELIFSDPAKRQLLNSILHPYIIARQDEFMQGWEITDPNGIGIVDAALMIESGGYKRFDKLVVVYCSPEAQLKRVMNRNSLTREQAEARIRAQLSQDEKKRLADYLIDTTEDQETTRRRTEKVYRALRDLAQQ